MSPFTTELLPEQTVARMLATRHEIFCAAMVIDPASKLVIPRDEEAIRHLNACNAAEAIREYLECVQERMTDIESPSAASLSGLIDKARQLEALHLWHLDGAVPF